MPVTSRVLGLAAAISIAAAGVPAAVGADQSSCQPGPGPIAADPSTAGGVNIHITANNSVMWCSAAAIEANSDVPDGTNYPLRSSSQSPSTNPVSNAISLSTLLTLAGINPAGVNHTDIAREDGTWSSLDTADLVDPSAQFQGALKPIFWINGSETQYLRPLRSPSDTNGSDSIVASNGVPADFYVYSGPVLAVTATTTPSEVGSKQPVTLTAHVTNAAAADGVLTYSWNLTDGSTATGASVTHSYAAPGVWNPVVTVLGAGNDSSGSQSVAVTVGSVPTGSNPRRPSGTNPNQHAHSGGPAKSHGKTPNTARSDKPSGGSATDNTPTSSVPSSTTPTTPTTSTTSTTTTPAPPAHKPAARAHLAATRTRKRSALRRQPAPPLSATTPVVKGLLISDLTPISAAQLAQQNSATRQPASLAHAPSAALGGGSVTPLAGIAGGCVIMLLLGSGAALELRSQGRPVAPTRTG